jgi:hypothetical protein
MFTAWEVKRRINDDPHNIAKGYFRTSNTVIGQWNIAQE